MKKGDLETLKYEKKLLDQAMKDLNAEREVAITRRREVTKHIREMEGK